ncbi:tissue factor pathway inhibitor 2-like [Cetorhinus maximus]
MELQLFTVICSILLLAPQFDIASADNREDCLMLPDPGPCKASSCRYYYNRYTQRCEKFIYGGCKGNENNFESVSECTLHCQRIKKVPKICRLEADVGPCRASFTRYFYNFTTGQCEDFVFGGCHGNLNNFKDISTCLKECKPISVSPSFCIKPKDRGLCAADILRFYFNEERGSCETFSYSGCGGNNNNFVSLKICQKICQPPDSKTVKIKNAPAAAVLKKIKPNRRKQFLRNPKRNN